MASHLETAIDIAREAGALLATYFERRVAFELKGEFDLVTEADRASEKLVVERLRTHFPSHSIVAEEGGGHEGSSPYRWYVDPLDGTTNFAHGYPIYNVTLGLEQDGEMLVGVVFDPTRQEMFSAERGAGAYLNNRRIRVSAAKRLEDSLVSTGFPSRKRHLNVNIHFYHQMGDGDARCAPRWGGGDRSGVRSLRKARCVLGIWIKSVTDMAAGTLLVTEAGGACSDMKGGPHSMRGPHLLTDNGAIHGETLDLFGEIFRGEFRVPMPVIG